MKKSYPFGRSLIIPRSQIRMDNPNSTSNSSKRIEDLENKVDHLTQLMLSFINQLSILIKLPLFQLFLPLLLTSRRLQAIPISWKEEQARVSRRRQKIGFFGEANSSNKRSRCNWQCQLFRSVFLFELEATIKVQDA